MAEYAGYVRRETPIDWNSVAGDIVNQLGDVKREQAATRKANDELAAKTYSQIGKYDAGQSPQINELAYNMITQGRATLDGMMKKLKNREITQDAFNRANMSMQTQNQEFKSMLNNYNANVAEIEKGMNEGTLSSLNNFNLDKFKDLSDLSNKQFQWVPKEDGIVNMYVNTIDENGNTIKNPQALNVIRNWENKRYAGYDLDANLDNQVKTLAVFDLGRTRDQRLNPEYKRTKDAIINNVLGGGDDERIATILADYDNYQAYEEGGQVPTKGIKMVLKSNGQYTPDITPELRKRAKEVVEQGIERRLGRTVRPGKAAKDPSGYSNNQINEFTTGHDIVWKAAGGDFEGMNLTNYAFEVLKDGIQVYKKEGGKQRPLGKPLKVGTVETARTLSKYSKEFGTSAQQSKFDIIQNKRGTTGSDLEIISEDVKVKSYSPSPQDKALLTSVDGNIFESVDRDYSDNAVFEAQTKIEEFIKTKAPNAVVEFSTSGNMGGGRDTYRETTIRINGVEVVGDAGQPLKIQHDKKGFKQNTLIDIITEAVQLAKKKKRFIVQTPGETPKDVSPNDNVAENNQKEEFVLD